MAIKKLKPADAINLDPRDRKPLGRPSAKSRATDPKAMKLQRKQFEKSDAGQARTTDLTGLMGHKSNFSSVGEAHAYMRGIGGDEHGNGAMTESEGNMFNHPSAPTKRLDEAHQANPDMVHKRRWEDFSHDEQKQVLAHVGRFGTNPNKMKSDYGAQIDQSLGRSTAMGKAYSSHFYEGPSEPHELVHSGIKEQGLTVPNGMLMQAQTSARTNFHDKRIVRDDQGNELKDAQGNTRKEDIYPNDIKARAAVTVHRTGQTARQVMAGTGVGMYDSVDRAAHLLGQRESGVPMRDLTHKSGQNIWDSGPKFSSYHGAWVEPNGNDQYFTSDTHSGHAFVPHLNKPQFNDYMTEPGVHALHDHLARTAHAERGLSSDRMTTQNTHFGQASQWGEQRIQSGETSEAEAYGRNRPTGSRGSSALENSLQFQALPTVNPRGSRRSQ